MENKLIKIDKGFVSLQDYMATDLSVVNSARVSFGQKSETLDDAGRGLIKFLMKNRHGTPFEHNSFNFHIKCPIFVAREWFRHRIGSFNEISMRYSKPDIEFWIPEKEDIRTQVGKPGAYTFQQFENVEAAEEFIERISFICDYATETYEWALEVGIAKEIARIVFPVNIYTQFYWTINARSLMNFLSLRNSGDAQQEIRRFAEALEDIFNEIMPHTSRSFIENNRVAP